MSNHTMLRYSDSTLVAWCPACEWYLPADCIGDGCPGDECERKLVKRRGWICDKCEFQNVFLSYEEYKEHTHE